MPLELTLYLIFTRTHTQYQVDDLKMDCEQYFINKVNDETAKHLLALADIFNAPKLKAVAQQWIQS